MLRLTTLLSLSLLPALAAAAPQDDTCRTGRVVFEGKQYTEGGSLRVRDSHLIGHEAAHVVQQRSSLRVSGGNLRLRDEAHFELGESSLNISDGNVVFTDSSTLTMGGGDFTVRDGNLRLAGSSNLIGIDTTIKVKKGRVRLQGESTVAVETSDTRITGGDFLLSERSTFFAGASSFHLGGGDLILSDSSTFDMGKSSLTVTGGNVELHDSGTVQLRGSSLSISGGGNLELSRSANLVLTDSTLDLRGGGATFGLSSVTVMVRSRVSATGGSVEFCSDGDKDDTTWVVEDSAVSVRGGGGEICGNTDHFLFGGTNTFDGTTGATIAPALPFLSCEKDSCLTPDVPEKVRLFQVGEQTLLVTAPPKRDDENPLAVDGLEWVESAAQALALTSDGTKPLKEGVWYRGEEGVRVYRLRGRPDLLLSEWDELIDQALTQL